MLQLMKEKLELNKEEHLFFDSLGIPHGEYRAKMMSLLGAITRTKAKVHAPNWKTDVPARVKDLIFDELRVLYTSQSLNIL